MKNALTASLAIALVTASPALASDDDDTCRSAATGQHMDQQQLRANLVEQGYDVRRIKVQGGCYEVYAIDKDGRRVELELDSVSGETLKTERDD